MNNRHPQRNAAILAAAQWSVQHPTRQQFTQHAVTLASRGWDVQGTTSGSAMQVTAKIEWSFHR